MARPGIETPRDSLTDTTPGSKVTPEKARQGQNVKGMLAVLVIGVLLVSGAYAVMLALQPQPSAVTEQSRENAVAATQQNDTATPAQRADPVN